ncbi:LysR family transcriptional regulator [Roseobacter weihaiensis]|uniref:LysR family transcriptional regulator n=1 Tax=Roseobacter weihaiensis TaxID=2763262 RepID=UPI001D0BAA6C|nr:LysR family transcriptional regulator [Roseobacter sp. H9]
MTPPEAPRRTHLSLSWLAAFRLVADSGSVRRAAEKMGLSVSTVSHQISCLEAHLRAPLLDHSRRPMALTAQGRLYLRYAEDILALVEQGQTAVLANTPDSLQDLRLALIDDFENDIGPELTRLLTAAFPACRLTSYTRPSHEILELLKDRAVDIGVATQPDHPIAMLEETPILRDPFVLAVPAGSDAAADAFVTRQTGLPFLSYNRSQIMGRMIEAQLTRLKLPGDPACTFDSTVSILALIAEGHGWAITTPTNYAHGKRFQPQIKLLPFPRKSFARTLSLFVAEPQAQAAAERLATGLRRLLAARVVAPTVEEFPWLESRFCILDR